MHQIKGASRCFNKIVYLLMRKTPVNMKKSICLSLLFCFSLAGLLGLSSCSDSPCADEEPSQSTYFYISETNKSKIPYHSDGLDTLVYISESGDSAILLGQGKANYFEKVAINRNSNPDCPFYDYNYFETIQYRFKDGFINGIDQIDIKYHTIPSSLVEEYLSIAVNTNMYRTYFISANNEQFYADSTIINGTTYYGRTLYGADDSPILYNFKFGVLQFTLNNKKWKLKR